MDLLVDLPNTPLKVSIGQALGVPDWMGFFWSPRIYRANGDIQGGFLQQGCPKSYKSLDQFSIDTYCFWDPPFLTHIVFGIPHFLETPTYRGPDFFCRTLFRLATKKLAAGPLCELDTHVKQVG